MESKASSVVVEDVKYSTFVLLMEYLYTDDVQISVETAMELFQVADRFTIDRLKSLCEQEMLNAIDIETAAHILYTADMYNAKNLREKCLSYILQHFDRVSRTSGFEEMGRINVDLSKSFHPFPFSLFLHSTSSKLDAFNPFTYSL